MEMAESSSGKGLLEGRAGVKEGRAKRLRKLVSDDSEPPDPAAPNAASHLFFPFIPCLCLFQFQVEFLSLTTKSPDFQLFCSLKLSNVIFPTSLPSHKLFLPPGLSKGQPNVVFSEQSKQTAISESLSAP